MTDFNGSTTSHAYDAMDRLLSRTPDTSSGELPVTFGYNATGQRTMMTEGSGTTAYTYDGQSRLLRKDTPAGTLVYTYDLTGNRLSVASSNTNGVNVSYTYDELNRLKAVVDGHLPAGSSSTTYSYDAAGNLSETVLPNGVRITPGRDGVDRVTNLPITSTPAANHAYTYGPAGNRLTADAASYGCDAIYRLTSETHPSGALSYLLDPVGSRLSPASTLSGSTSQSLAYHPNDRIVGNTYDANGNTLVSGARTFAWDSQNRLMAVNGGVATMLYDGDGNRVGKNGIRYLEDDNNPTGRRR